MAGDSIAARKRRWEDRLAGRDARPLFMIAFDPDAGTRPQPWPSLKQERIEHAWGAYCRQRERCEWLRDDTVPYLDPYTGTEIFAEAFGCQVHRPEGDMPSARPLVTTAKEAARLRTPEVSSSSLGLLFEIADELRRRAGPEAVMRVVDLQSPMDIAALIWDKNHFYTAMIEEPEAVKELSAKVASLLTAFLDEWFSRYGTEFVAHYPDYYMPRGVTISEDEVGSVNEGMFEEFFRPELVALSERYGGMGLHCCAHARHQWGNFLRIPGLRLLNLVQPTEVLQEAYRRFADHLVQFHSWFGEGPAWTWPSQQPKGARVVCQATAGTKEEAQELSDRLWEACGRS